jgi:hypothetical protein
MSAPHDHPLVKVFEASITQLSVLLAAFHPDHPVVQCYNEFFANKSSSSRDTEAAQWLSNLRLSPTPELESLMQAPMHKLLTRNVLGIGPVERRRRVLAVGSALLQLLAIQHELNEELLGVSSERFSYSGRPQCKWTQAQVNPSQVNTSPTSQI